MSVRPRWYLDDLAEVPLFVRMAAALRRASADGRETCATVLAARAAAHPDRTLLRFEDGDVPCGVFDAETNRVAHLLGREGVGRGDVFAIAMRNSPSFLAAQCAAARTGAIAALVNHHLGGDALRHVLASSRAKLVLSDEETAPAVADALAGASGVTGSTTGITGIADLPHLAAGLSPPPGARSLEDALADLPADPPPPVDLRGRDPFLYIFTSGTTGHPKAAPVRHMKFTMGGIALSGILGIGPGDTVYAPLPLYHGQSNFVGFAVALRSGGAFASRRAFSAGAFLDDVRRHDARMLVYVGELCRYLLAQPETPGDRDHRLRIAAGAGLRPDVWEPFCERFGIERVLELYGATEGNVSLMNRSGRPGSVGRPAPFQHHTVRIARHDLARGELVRGPDGFLVECDVDEPGELLGRVGAGPIPYDGYVDEAASETKLVRDAFRRGDAWFRSGDLLSRDARGDLFFVDRLGDTFRWKGENVSTQEVAETLNALPFVQETNVYGVEVPGHDGRAGMAAIVLAPGHELDPARDLAALHTHAAANLPPYAAPLFLRVLDAMDTTGTLKQRKVALQAEGFDPAAIADPLYLRDDEAGTFGPLTPEVATAIADGSRRV